MTVPASTSSPSVTSGLWLTQVPWLERANLRSGYSSTAPSSRLTVILLATTRSTLPALRASSTSPVSAAALNSMPVPTYGASLRSSGTA